MTKPKQTNKVELHTLSALTSLAKGQQQTNRVLELMEMEIEKIKLALKEERKINKDLRDRINRKMKMDIVDRIEVWAKKWSKKK